MNETQANSGKTATRRALPAGRRMLIVAPILLVLAVAVVFVLRETAPLPETNHSRVPSLPAAASPRPIAVLGDGTPLKLRLDRNFEKLIARSDAK